MSDLHRGIHASYRKLFTDADHLTVQRRVSRDDVFAHMDVVGVDSVLEFVASGRLLTELAIMLEFPIIYVREWAEKNLDKGRLRTAMKAYAESCLVKAQLSLQMTPENPQEAQVMRATAEHYTWAAERVDSDTWGPPKKSAEAPPAVSIVFNLPPKPEEIPAQSKEQRQPEFARIIEHVAVPTE